MHYSAVYGVRVLGVQPTIRFEDIRHLIEAVVLFPQDVVPHKLKYIDRDETVIIQSDEELAAAFRTWWVNMRTWTSLLAKSCLQWTYSIILDGSSEGRDPKFCLVVSKFATEVYT